MVRYRLLNERDEMYICEQCGEVCEVQGEQSVEGVDRTPYIAEYVVCQGCGYTIPKDTADVIILLEAAEEIIRDFNTCGKVLQLGDNGEYGCESAIGRLVLAVESARE